MDWTAITGIVVSGVLGPGIGSWYALRRVDREHESSRVLADRTDARTLLDEVAANLGRVGRNRGGLGVGFLWHGDKLTERAPEILKEVAEGLELADGDTARLTYRFGPDSDIARAHKDAMSAALRASNAVFLACNGPEPSTIKDARTALTETEPLFEDAHRRFVVAAHDLVSTQMEPTPLIWQRSKAGRVR